MLHIEYQISEDDFVAAAKLMLRKRRGMIYAALFAILGVIWVGLAVQAFMNSQPIFGGLLLLCSIYFFCFPLRRTRSLRKQYRKRPSLGKPTCLEIDETEIRSISPDADERMSWSLYEASAEDDKSFLLIQQGKLLFVPIPTRQLSSDQLSELRAIVSSHLSQI